ncbi:50S ribosomal protein L19 [Clostridium sp. D2Q-11]|uniref:Large ribosomal subunit protein bL19 n=1 Tax=Anaeromonas frigoriresistens TaxID=2683708 RepID=A0A942V0R3_9FIRM|nr:50S ribosomal protein L19 [Anaeromonas frigoriresistens]MBS4539776.1 50S ribosomal protein L19 [Anaeromonas frigoriresistens]
MDIIKMIEQEQMSKEITDFNVGDTVQVHYHIKEGNRERVQVFEGTVIKRQGGSNRETFTVRRISYGVGVERTFALHSPKIEKLVVTRRGSVRRSRLFYLRERTGKRARVKEKRNY